MSTNIISLMNQKGGVGKTTSTMNLGHALAMQGKKVLVVDVDYQRNLTTTLGTDEDGFDIDFSPGSIADLLTDIDDPSITVYQTRIENLSLIPSLPKLSDVKLYEMEKDVLRKSLLRIEGFDYILIDTPPSVSEITILALVASTDVLIPLEFSKYGVEGIYGMQRSITVAKEHNPELNILGLFATRSRKRNAVAQVIRCTLPENYLLLNTEIPESTEVVKSQVMNQTIHEHKGSHPVAQSYLELADEIEILLKEKNLAYV